MDFRHRAIGLIDPEHRQGVGTGWKHLLDGIAHDALSSVGSAQPVGQRS